MEAPLLLTLIVLVVQEFLFQPNPLVEQEQVTSGGKVTLET